MYDSDRKRDGGGTTRRGFLKLGLTGAATAVAAATAAPALADPQPGHSEHPRRFPPRVDHQVTTTCAVCFWKCGVTADVAEDGTPLHLHGNPGHPLSRGKLCPRGVGGIGFYEDDDRLTEPQLRTGERGEGFFENTSWDTAIGEIAERLQAVIDEHGRGSVAFLTHGSAESYFYHLAHAIGTPHSGHPANDQCKGPREAAFKLTFGHPMKSPEPVDIENTDCLVLIGSHLGENMHNLQVQEMVSARIRGAKIIVVDPRRSVAAERADIWLQIRPGTDLALLLAWAHILIRDGRYDHEFVENHCYGFHELSRHVQQYTPEWAAGETDLTVEEIEASASMLADAGPHNVIHPGRHVVWHGNDTQRERAMAILVGLTGAWGARGGYYLPQKVHMPTLREVFDISRFPREAQKKVEPYPFGLGVGVDQIRQATLAGEIKAWIVVGTNLMTSVPAPHLTEQAIDNLDFIAVIDVLPTEITKYADVLLPAASYLERDDKFVITQSRDPFIALTQKVTDPPGNAKPEAWMAKAIGEAMDLGEYWDWEDMVEFNRRMVEAHNEHHAEEGVIDWDTLVERGYYVVSEGNPIYREGKGLGPDGSGRAGAEMVFRTFGGAVGGNKCKFYSPEMARIWQQLIDEGHDPSGYEPLPTYYRPETAPPGMVRLIYGRSPVHTFGRTQNTPVLAGREDENKVWVSPETAEAFGVSDARHVMMINQDGVEQGPIRLHVTNKIRTDAVYITHGHGHNSRQLSRAWRRGVNDTALMTRYVVDPLNGGTAMRVNYVRLVKPRHT